MWLGVGKSKAIDKQKQHDGAHRMSSYGKQKLPLLKVNQYKSSDANLVLNFK